MIAALIQLFIFLIEILLIVAAILIILSAFAGLFIKEKSTKKIMIKKINHLFFDLKKEILKATLNKKEYKKISKLHKKEKSRQKNKVYVLDFKGDMQASQVQALREEISAILSVATPNDEVVLRLESPGGVIHGYGLAASQLARLRDKNIPLTVCIDKVAASGGYLMACCADRIYAAPFAIIGSIGVVAQLPNFNRFLKDKKIDFEQITAGKFKRTLSLFGENTAEGREKFQEEIDEAHTIFKNFVHTQRPQLNIDAVATGEHWLAQQAIHYQLVDRLITSDDYLLAKIDTSDVYELRYPVKKKFSDKWMKASALLFG